FRAPSVLKKLMNVRPGSVTMASLPSLIDSVPVVDTILQEMNQERKEMILKLLSGLLDNAAVSGQTGSEAGYPEPADGGPVMLEERSRYSQLPQRSRKVPCKNFFWKTFTSC
uniref:Somatostatin/Cortistatin C-terminal domain-containing protein n=1 Tax=Callorhinchus milii TaxID=7868 RepID=A0A4W3H2Q1_CALMI